MGSDPGPALPAEVRALAREVEVWEADLLPMPARIDNQEGKRTVAALVAAGEAALGTELLLTSIPPVEFDPLDEPPPHLQDLVQEIEDAGLESQEDIRAFLDQRVGDYNRTPLEGLGGISPAQAQALIEGGLEGNEFLQVADDLSLPELQISDFLHNARLFLQRLHETAGAKATKAGKLKRAFVKTMLEEMRLPPGYMDDVFEMNKVVNEQDAWVLHVLRVNLEIAGLVAHRKGTFTLTRKGRSMLPPESAGRLQAYLFQSYFTRFNLEYGLRGLAGSSLQPVVPLLLWQVGSGTEAWISLAELARRVLPPNHDPKRKARTEGWSEDAADLHYQILEPLKEFGLLEERLSPEAEEEWYPAQDSMLLRKTPLFDRFLRFTWD